MVQSPPPPPARDARSIRNARVLGVACLAAGLACAAPAFFIQYGWPLYVRSFATPLAYLGAALLLVAAAVLGACIMDAVRRSNVTPGRTPAPRGLARLLARGGKAVPLDWAVAWGPVAAAAAVAGLALAAATEGWQLGTLPLLAAPSDLQVFGGALLVLAFPFLVLERTYASDALDALPEAPQINRILRVAVVACLGLGVESLLLSAGYIWGQAFGMAVAAIAVAVSLEILLRCAAMLFLPFAPRAQRRAVVDSTVAGLLRLSVPRLRRLSLAIKHQFGIDLSRSWALAFVQRALVPLAAGLLLFVWLLTGVTAVGVAERVVYERLGRAHGVLHAGLHLHLPWPLGIVRRVEFGVIREAPVILAYDPPPGSAGRPSYAPIPPLADGPARPEDDRLWTSVHPSEGTYLIASVRESQSQGGQSQDSRQGFQAVNADLTVVYRIGLSDADALKALYAMAEPEVLMRAIAGRLLAQHFARYTLSDVLGQNREALAEAFRMALQRQLDDLESGIEAIAVIVEAIHPPPGAAYAYHNVQASQIRSQASIAEANGKAVNVLKAAQKTAATQLDQSRAAAEEVRRQADAESILFATDRTAFALSRPTFLLERWFEKLTRNLKEGDLLIIDHRLGRQSTPTIDLRPFSPEAPASPAYTPPLGGDDDHQ